MARGSRFGYVATQQLAAARSWSERERCVVSEQRALSFFRISAQYENVGDALIIRELLSLVSHHSDIVVDVSQVPTFFAKDILATIDPARLSIVEKEPLRDIFRRVLKARSQKTRLAFFFLPSGITGEKGKKFVLRMTAQYKFYGLLRALGVHFFQFGPSYSRIGPRHQKLIGRRIRLMDRHLVRDARTAEYLQEIGLRCDGLIPDLSFGLYRDPPRMEDRNVAAFSFRVDRDAGDAARLTAWVDEVVAKLPKERPLKFVSQVRRDDAFMRSLHDRHRADRAASLTLSDSIEGSLTAYGDVAEIYSNRLHCLLMAAYMGAKPVALVEANKDEKIIGIFTDFGIADNLILDPSDLKTDYGSLDRDRCQALCLELEQKVASAF